MTRAQYTRWVWLLLSLAAQSSCGGAGRERPPADVARHARGDAPGAVTAAKAQVRPVPQAAEHAETVASGRSAALPVPADAWTEHAAGERAMRAAFEQRFPLHGVAFHMLAQVYAEPSDEAQVVGYLRRGTRFRASPARSGRGCKGGKWHELAASGFVCTARGFLVGEAPQSFEPSPRPAALHDALPYSYAKNTAHAALQYWRVPSVTEEKQALAMLAALPAPLSPAPAVTPPADLAGIAAGAPAIALPDYTRMAMEPGFYVSVDREALADDLGTELPPPAECTERGCGAGRRFVRTVRGAYVPAAALTQVQVADAPGVVLGGELTLPLGIVYRGAAKLLLRDAATGAWQPGEKLPRYAHVALTGARSQQGAQAFFETRSGALVSEPQLRVAQRAARPPIVPRRARWIHVSRADQTLVAYDGDRPVFATLVATGKQGYDTPAGVFRIQAKHVSATMDGLAGSDEAYSIEDVPWTMYFQGSYALHAAFWHDRFGAVRSHGCVNLAPADAQWLFRWAAPLLPAGYHGVVATKDNPGTYVVIE